MILSTACLQFHYSVTTLSKQILSLEKLYFNRLNEPSKSSTVRLGFPNYGLQVPSIWPTNVSLFTI